MSGKGAGIAEGGNRKLGQPWDWQQREATAAPRGHLQAGTTRGGVAWHDLIPVLASEARGAEKRLAFLPIVSSTVRAARGPDLPERTGK